MTACTNNDSDLDNIEYTENVSNDEKFDLRLYIKDEVHKSRNPIKVYATLEYIGEDEEIIIWHGNPSIQFMIIGDDGFIMDPITLDELRSTTLEKGIVYEFPFVKSGGWDPDGKNAKKWKKFFEEEELFLDRGNYKMRVFTNFNLGDNDIEYSNKVEAEIKVK